MSEQTSIPADPELDPTASYATDQTVIRRLSGLLRATAGTRTSYAPATGQPIADLPVSSEDDVIRAVRVARKTQQTWRRVPLAERAAILLRYHDLVLDHRHELVDLIIRESGKARKQAFEELAHVALTARYYGRKAQELLEPQRKLGIFPVLTRAEERFVPKGVVGIISPWNYPLTMAISDGLPAILAGNTVVHKPDSQTPLTALRAIELLYEAGLPRDAWLAVNGDGPTVGGALIQNADYICFTGSTRTGRLVAKQCGERLIGCSLELGGKNPMLVLRDADINRAAEGAIRACFANAGQLCVSMERLYVADQVYDAFVTAFVDRVKKIRLSAGTGWDVDMGSLISKAQLETVTRHVEDARSQGATVLAGGKPRPDIGPLFYEPTVLSGVTPAMECFDNETFGPVVSIYRFSDESEAIQRANEGEYGLNASVWSRDGRRGRAVAAQLMAGTVNVNEGYGATFGSIDTPMGGMRSSGLGRRQGVEGIRRYVEPQAIATQRLIPIAASHGLSDEKFAELMTGALRVLKKIGRP
ncbi:succinic semialdehyde dehydrogenase [Kribbella kalugense]|uniref:Succinate-semialdehyde dehydrogenase/glutarate-semialdehyde dehydrogenase n=1 Tax=Kribbella kalugense TaxID=2512221 RepID=A0A4R7ZHX8_9ACTN|nr:succinic semialdehyde dehydrogenase [Kribbella kalugense]TDW16982.1 succinate-semialdehyde dehydrogenase/glutarate-semialdehyde dehydrogenase [Kribbella kalugense]